MDEQSVLDSTLPKEWSLLELPDPTLHMSEFEQVFGASDDENDEFPLSFKGLSGDVGIVGNDPQTSQFLISSIQETLRLEGLEEGRTEPSQSNHSTSEETGKPVDIPLTKPDTVDDRDKQLEECVKENEVEEARPAVNSDDVDTGTKEEKETTPPRAMRKSTRLQRKRFFEGAQSPNHRQSKARKRSKSEENAGDSEKCTVAEPQDSTNAKPSSEKSAKDDEDLGKKKETAGQEEGTEVEGSEDEGDVSESDEDPDRLWCICRQPHNDRFMICCDKCGEWYHGDCIGISVTEGKKMEKMGVDYICVRCCDHEKELKKEREKNRSLRQARRDSIREKQVRSLGKLCGGQDQKMSRDRTTSSSSVTTPTESKQNELDQLFQPDNISDSIHAPSEPKLEIAKGPCIGPNCSKSAIKPSLYCSEHCIERHMSKALERLAARGANIGADPMERIKGGGGVTLYEPATRKYLMGVSAPSHKDLLPWLKAHPSYHIFIPAGKAPPKKIRKTSDSETKSSQPSQEPAAAMDTQTNPFTPNGIRENAKNAFKRALWLRVRDAADITLAEEEVEKIAHDIEVKLFNVHNQEVTSKYRSKCRSLLFNLKDTKNPGLFRKVLIGEITTRQLVRMNPEQLASEELTQWREKTMKKELDMIKEVAEEEAQIMSSHTVRKMTYKGEVEIERTSENELPIEKTETSSEVKAVEAEPKPSVPTVPVASQTPPTQSSKSKPTSVSILNILTNTTDQHSSHVFDQNCDICLGKKPPPEKPPPEKPPLEKLPPEKPPLEKPSASVQTAKEPTVSSSPVEKDASESDQPMTSAASPEASIAAKEQSPNVASPVSGSLSLRVTSSLRPFWKGYMAMHGMEQFLTTAYPVSGNMDGLAEVFPPCLQVVGRIAHVQVWDYIDKLRSSLSKEIAVVRFDRVAEDKNLYLEMMDYLVGKHRYGVFQTFSSWMKDMYLIPLQFDDPPPVQILPFVGPGLPVNRRDLFLGIIVRTIKHPSTASDRQQVSSKHASRVHFAADVHQSSSSLPKSKRPRLEVNLSESTSPVTPLGVETTSPMTPAIPGESSKDASPVTAPASLGYSGKEASPVAVVSFYGKHQPLQEEEKAPEQRSPTISQSGIKSILSQLSDQKLQELASAMSSLQQPHAESAVADHKSSSLSLPPRGDPRIKSGDDHVTQPTTMSLDERLSATFGYSAKPSHGKEEARPTTQRHWEPPAISQDSSHAGHAFGRQDRSPPAGWQEPHPTDESHSSYSNSQAASYTTIYDARRGGGQQPKPSFFSPPPPSYQSQEPSQVQEQTRRPASHHSYPGPQQPNPPQPHPNQPQSHPTQPQSHPNQPQPPPPNYYNQSQQQYRSHDGYYDNQQQHSAPYQQPPGAGYYGNQPQHGYHQYGSQEHHYPAHFQQQPHAGNYAQQDDYRGGGGRERGWRDGSHYNHHQQRSNWHRGEVEARREHGQPLNDDGRDRHSEKYRYNPEFGSAGPRGHRPWRRR